MISPFPGMNPYLENPVFWSEVHHRLIAIIADEIEPNIPPQLQSGDKEVFLDLQPLLNRIYARARYHLTIDYNQEPIPPLKGEDKAWADTIICGIGN
jgi:hypothetical protein